MYSKLYARSFGKQQQKKMGLLALVACFLMVLSFCAVFDTYNNAPITILNFQRNIGDGILSTTKTNRLKTGCKCNFSHPRTEFCEINGDVRINGNLSTIFVPSSILHDAAQPNNESVWKVRPYARKIDGYIMSKVRKFSMGSPSSFGLGEMPQCSINHKVPAIVFSSGGYTGNFFHDFNDVLVPLYITSRHFNGDVQFLVADKRPKWLKKHETLLSSLSTHKIIDIDNTNEVHCFPSMIIGLKSHIELGIDPNQPPQGYTMRNFTDFVRKSYSLKRSKVEKMVNGSNRKPRLLIISRTTTRVMVNEDEVAAEARSLGFDVAVVNAGRELRDFSKTVNSFDVMVGVHGAGLTNSVFLPKHGVLVQIVPVGLEWLSKVDFETPASAMGLRYLDYKLSWKESSLSDKYDPEDPLMRKLSIKSHGFVAFKKVYLDGQNVRIDVGRFRTTLLKALDLLRQ